MSVSCISILHVIGLAFLLLSTHCVFVQFDVNLIAQRCQKTPYYNLCISSLQSHPRSSNADVRGLALIMVNIIKARATETVDLINQLLQKSPELKHPLSACADNYNAILKADIPQATEALEKGDFKFAEEVANDSGNESDSCEDNFHRKSPLN